MSYYFVGLDLGQAQDFTALAIAELMGRVGPSQERGFHLRHLERFPLRTPYPRIVARTGALLGSDELRGRARLVVDGVAPVSWTVKCFRSKGRDGGSFRRTWVNGSRVRSADGGGCRRPR